MYKANIKRVSVSGIHPPPTQSTKAVYNRIIDLKIATPQIIINYGLFLEEHNYFEEAFKVSSNLTGRRLIDL